MSVLLKCNQLKLSILNCDSIPEDQDDALEPLLERVKSVFIVREGKRSSKLETRYPDCPIYRPSLMFTIMPGKYVERILFDQGVEPYDACYVTGNPNEIHNVHEHRLSTVLFASNDSAADRTKMPEFEVDSFETLLDFLVGDVYGYFGELFAHGVSGRGMYKGYELVHQLAPDVKAWVLASGRYFTSQDHRAYIHPFTQKTLQLKNGKHINPMAELLARTLTMLNQQHQIDYVTTVPGRPGESNRLLPLLEATTAGQFAIAKSLLAPSLLSATQSYAKQKEAGSWTKRYLNVHGVFQCLTSVRGHVVIVDDILTSGATAMECARMLYDSGAETVSIVVLGLSQSTIEVPTYKPIPCNSPTCDGHYVIRFRNSNNTAFYGCSNYPRCNSITQFESGRLEYNVQGKMVSNDTPNSVDSF